MTLIRSAKRKRRVDYTGRVYPIRTVIKFLGYEQEGFRQLYECRDIFGAVDVISSNSLRNRGFGNILYNKESYKLNTKLRNTHQDMLHRCRNKNNKAFHCYGGRGISVCDEWSNSEIGFQSFRLWAISVHWKPGLSLDRIDVNGNYSPDNCRFVTRSENSKYRRTTKLSKELADAIRQEHAESGKSVKETSLKLSSQYRVSSKTIQNLLYGGELELDGRN